MAPTELHKPVETFLGVVWPYDKLWKCFPDNFLSNAPTLVVIRQLLKYPTYLVQKVHFTSQKKWIPLSVYPNYKFFSLFKIIWEWLWWVCEYNFGGWKHAIRRPWRQIRERITSKAGIFLKRFDSIETITHRFPK